jgi:excisionase family DNA binding protein
MSAVKSQSTRRDAAEASLVKLLDTNETADVIGIGRRTLQERVTAREISVVRIGKAVRFHPDDIAAFIERNRVKAAGWKEAK